MSYQNLDITDPFGQYTITYPDNIKREIRIGRHSVGYEKQIPVLIEMHKEIKKAINNIRSSDEYLREYFSNGVKYEVES